MEAATATFYDIEAARSIAQPRVYAGGPPGGCGGVLMTELAMLAGHRGVRSSLIAPPWPPPSPFDCYHDQAHRVAAAPEFGVPPAAAFSIECLLTGRHAVDEPGLQLRPGTDNLNLLHIGKLARTADIDGQ